MWRDEAYLLDMLIGARRALQFAAGLSWTEFASSELHQDAITRALEIVGEAARKVSAEVRQAHPEIPWIEIVGMRHRLVHDYFHIDLEKVWATVQDDVPKLIGVLEPLVPPER